MSTKTRLDRIDRQLAWLEVDGMLISIETRLRILEMEREIFERRPDILLPERRAYWEAEARERAAAQKPAQAVM